MKVLKLSLLGLALSAGPIVACAVAPHANQAVAIADESAIIIWDAASKTEHFIRRASFQTGAKDFGFLVPTPSKPELAEASDAAFKYLAEVTAPRVVNATRSTQNPGCGCGAKSANLAMMAPGNKVEVLEEKRVAGYDAVVLAANDSAALGKWLKDHDYEFSPALTEWVKPYLTAGWKITAFKIAKDAEAPSVSTSAVRLTFKTDKPFYPYREPQSTLPVISKLTSSRLLRVYLLGDAKFTGNLGESGAWPGRLVWAKPPTSFQRDQLRTKLNLPEDALREANWLTEFEDHSSPRPGTDDVFSASTDDKTPVERPVITHYASRSFPDCVMCFALVACLFAPQVGRWMRRYRS